MGGAGCLAHRCLFVLIPATAADAHLPLPVLAELGLRKLPKTSKRPICGPWDSQRWHRTFRTGPGSTKINLCEQVAERKACGLTEVGGRARVPSLLRMTLGREDTVDEGRAEAKGASGPLSCRLGWGWEWAWPPLAWTPKCHAYRLGVRDPQVPELSVSLMVETVRWAPGPAWRGLPLSHPASLGVGNTEMLGGERKNGS